MKKSISKEDGFWIQVTLVIIVLFGGFFILHIDSRLDKLEDAPKIISEKDPCYINVGKKMFVVGIPNGNEGYGYYQVDPSFRKGKEVEHTKNELKLCDGTIFVGMITEIYNNEKLLNDVLLGAGE